MQPEARRDNLLIEEVNDELVIYDQRRDHAHSLNRTAAWIWQRCDGLTTVAAMAARLPSELDIPADEEVVWLGLERLYAAGLILRRPVRPDNEARLTRRQVIRRVGLATALPVIISMVAPTPAGALSIMMPVPACGTQSGGGCSGFCTSPGTTCKQVAGGGGCGCAGPAP